MFQRVMSYIQSGKQDGASVHVGGERAREVGLYIQPTVFTDVTPDMRIMREEIFGPVVVLVKFKTEEEALKMANDSTYGLSSNVLTQNLNRAIRVAHALEAGQVFVSRTFHRHHDNANAMCVPQVNSPFVPMAQVSFGGVKQSGFGRDLGEYALHE